ncbi:mitogen-activated protein kinase kinase kinase 14 [Oryzias latipes]|uniref:Mitogen-activated protein kinase kinase kinase 14a n=1 Tax=Oryzias latipes TaxID=8090 RepID=H2LIB5_ORYLA|nr:mitogen-activated protein kinase kinase kinase 14 [Oryzias latipes]XP_011476293.1 mitogen-activated protein kinase kinase kinase 14 [Oryzias latipes]XP_011476294.1 mitogen-activated protein kinase kinase kinase 14 [Oryzias latipes]
MAVRQRFFNSTAPFSDSPKELKGTCPSYSSVEQETEDEEEEGKDNTKGYVDVAEWAANPFFNKLLTQGTAEQVGEKPIKTSTIIAQAECETQDSQEFSPSCYERSFVPSPNCFTSSLSCEHNNVACPTTASYQEQSGFSSNFSPRKKSRRRQKRKGAKKKERRTDNQRQRRRTPSGVPEQESGSSQAQILESLSHGESSDLSSSCCSSSTESLETQERRASLYPLLICDTGSSCSPLNWPQSFCRPFSRPLSYEQENSSDSLSSVGDCSLALAGLRGSVSQGDPCFAGPFFKDVERELTEEEDELSASSVIKNEGIIFYNDKIQPVDSEYKEGSEYTLTHFIKQGSYGEVRCAQDVKTGFKFAVKKIALRRFISEEVGAWSALRSPRVVELFGVIRDGPNIVLLMDLKSGCLGDLIKRCGRLPEDLSLHYHSQVLAALEYLVKKRVAHLDIKADNVLLSEDGRDSYLCDFGHAEKVDHQGQSLSGFKDLKGTESHMAPEIVKGEPRGTKADVWSSCCMLLHMLNGCQPWTRYYTCRLYLKIANEPPPLREIPGDCSPLTADVLKAGLQKDPVKRLSASDLKLKTDSALKQVGGLTSVVEGPYTTPLHVQDKLLDSQQLLHSSADFEADETQLSVNKVISAGLRTKKPDDEEDVESNKSFSNAPQMLIHEPNYKNYHEEITVPELELRKLERDLYLSSLSQLHSAEMQEQLLSCLNSDHCFNREPWDKKDSGRWSLSPGDDPSSGFFSSNSQPEVQPFSIGLLGQFEFPLPSCLEGVDVHIRDFSCKTIRIREKRRVKVGHIATGISDQISERVFTLETAHGRQVPHNEEVQESGLELRCVPAPDFSRAWSWRIKDGLLETRESPQV